MKGEFGKAILKNQSNCKAIAQVNAPLRVHYDQHRLFVT